MEQPGPGGFPHARGRALQGRSSECQMLNALLDRVRTGQSAALVIHGDAGVGKTALLTYAESAPDVRVVRAIGVESEKELPYAALHQLCGPMFDRLGSLPAPQREALEAVFGRTVAAAPDRFLVGLAMLSLLSETAAGSPLLCVVDDAQWLDRESAQALAVAARRLQAEPVLALFAMREPDAVFGRLPELRIEGLRDADARRLLDSAVRWPIDERVRDRIVAETRGNPLALLELPRGLTSQELAGGFASPETLPVPGRVEDSFLRRVEDLPRETRLLLTIAAADPTGDVALVWRAAARLGLGLGNLGSAESAGLVEFGASVRFRHPLVRSAAYRAASPAERRRAHDALAEATDPPADPDRRAWHRAQAAPGPDDDVADELERSADRAKARGGLAAAAAFLERSSELTLDPARQAWRALSAAQAKYQAGAFDAAAVLLTTAEAGPPDEHLRARVSLLRGQMAFSSRHSGDAPAMLLETARRFEEIDTGLAREIYLDAMSAAMFAGRLAAGAGFAEIAAAARGAPAAPRPSRASDMLLDGLAVVIADGYAVGAPVLQRAVNAFLGDDLTPEEQFRWSFIACHSAHDLWDDGAWDELSGRYLQFARDVGALSALPIVLSQRVGMHLHAGEFAAAASLAEETDAITDATGDDIPPYSAMAVAAWQGKGDEATRLIQTVMDDALPRGDGMGLTLAQYTSAMLNNGLGNYDKALAAASQATAYPEELGFAQWGLVELIEAAAHSGDLPRATAALEQLARTTRPSGTPWGLGIEARSRALISTRDEAELLYQEAIDQLGRCRGAMALARAHLIYGEWLHGANRYADAREQLRTAHEMFQSSGAAAFAARARRELAASGETVRKRVVQAPAELTAQERQIARRAREGQTNVEIGTELFLSPRTVEWHLRKVFAKLGITSRRELRRVSPAYFM